MSVQVYISELKGYLKALQHICGPSFNFGVKCSYFDGEIEEFLKINDHGYHIEKSVIIDFQEVKNEIHRFVLNGMLTPKQFPNAGALKYYK